MNRSFILFLLFTWFGFLSAQTSQPQMKKTIKLESVAFSKKQWTGIAISKTGRIFVNFPRWSDRVTFSVAELIGREVLPYPNKVMNQWTAEKDPATHFVCVQAMLVDQNDQLWILDPANPKFQGVIEKGPKLLQVDLKTNSVVKTYHVPPDIALKDSYLNDLRVDNQRNFVYLTDSGNGALIVLNLNSGQFRRVLDHHVSTEAEDITLVVGGKPWKINGVAPKIHADGIAYDATEDRIFYQPLTGRTMYQLSAALLRQFERSEEELAANVKVVGKTGASDGLIFGPEGKIYISALEQDAILRTTPRGKVEVVAQHPDIAWPDSFSFGPDGSLYFTTARIHEGATPKKEYGIHRILFSKHQKK